MKKQDMVNLSVRVHWRANGPRDRDNICVSWEDPQDNRYHFWIRPDYSGKIARGLDEVANDKLYVNPPEPVDNQPRAFDTKILKASAKCNQPLIARAFAVIDIPAAYRAYDQKEIDERNQRERERIEVRKKQRLARTAPALLASLKALLEFVPKKCRLSSSGDMVPRKDDPQTLAVEIAEATIAQAEEVEV